MSLYENPHNILQWKFTLHHMFVSHHTMKTSAMSWNGNLRHFMSYNGNPHNVTSCLIIETQLISCNRYSHHIMLYKRNPHNVMYWTFTSQHVMLQKSTYHVTNIHVTSCKRNSQNLVTFTSIFVMNRIYVTSHHVK